MGFAPLMESPRGYSAPVPLKAQRSTLELPLMNIEHPDLVMIGFIFYLFIEGERRFKHIRAEILVYSYSSKPKGEDEIQSIKAQKVQLQHRIKQEAEQFWQWKASREKELLQALQRKTEEAAMATKRLKELLEACKSSACENSVVGQKAYCICSYCSCGKGKRGKGKRQSRTMRSVLVTSILKPDILE